MFKAVVNQMEYTYSELQSQIRQLNNQISEACDVVKALHSLSGLEEVNATLQKHISHLEEEQETLRQMMFVLSRAAACYRQNERRITDECTQSRIWTRKGTPGYSDIGNIQNTISKFHFY
ncbi:hypothetical protein ABFV83_11355 [Lacrimispora sp. BS-2]|uniref:Uncharacterized protein n=1 Tax=Lacrimispora sp. BS-2 TaxID=3151850 RepID=A0AAU7PJG4_9FIRM